MPPSLAGGGEGFLHSLLDPELVLSRLGDALARFFSLDSFFMLLATLMLCKWTYQYVTWDQAGELRAKMARKELQAKQREILGELACWCAPARSNAAPACNSR